MSEETPTHGSDGEGRKGRDGRPEMDRLPPPAFPPGLRRRPLHRPRGPGAADGEAGRHFPEGAYFSPDAPIRRAPGDEGQEGWGVDLEAVAAEAAPAGDGGGSGIAEGDTAGDVAGRAGGKDVDGRAPASREGHPTPYTPSPATIAALLEELAGEVRGLRGRRIAWKPDCPPLEAALRGVLSGYLKPRGHPDSDP